MPSDNHPKIQGIVQDFIQHATSPSSSDEQEGNEQQAAVADVEDCARPGAGATANCGYPAGACGSCSCQVVGIHGVVPHHVAQAARVYLALQRVIAHHALSALTIRCFDLLMTSGDPVAGCLAVSLL